MSFTVEVSDSVVRARLQGMPAKLQQALARKTTTLRLLLEAKVKAKLSGDVLQVRSGALRRSIFSDQSETTTSVEGRVAQSADVPYGRIHEFGGKTAAHDILPKKGDVLAFVMGGKQVFAKVVHHPGSQIPERSFMRSSLHEMEAAISNGYKQAALKEAGL